MHPPSMCSFFPWRMCDALAQCKKKLSNVQVLIIFEVLFGRNMKYAVLISFLSISKIISDYFIFCLCFYIPLLSIPLQLVDFHFPFFNRFPPSSNNMWQTWNYWVSSYCRGIRKIQRDRITRQAIRNSSSYCTERHKKSDFSKRIS